MDGPLHYLLLLYLLTDIFVHAILSHSFPITEGSSLVFPEVNRNPPPLTPPGAHNPLFLRSTQDFPDPSPPLRDFGPIVSHPSYGPPSPVFPSLLTLPMFGKKFVPGFLKSSPIPSIPQNKVSIAPSTSPQAQENYFQS